MTKLNFDEINQRCIAMLESLLNEWLPQGKREGNEYKIGSLSGEPGRSLSINLRTGVWKDFASDAGGSDPISLLAAIRGSNQGQAAKELAERFGTTPIEPAPKPSIPTPPIWQQIMPPDDMEEPSFTHHKNGEPSAVYPYHATDGRIIGYICRYDTPTGKTFAPRIYATNGTKSEWRWVGFSIPRPLYGLHLLAASPQSGVVIVEGEKAADAARALSPGVVVTWMSGSNSVKKTDWTPLKGRKVIIWPDRDAPGRQAAFAIQDALTNIAESVKIIAPPQGEDDGWDLADAAAEGWTRQQITEHIKTAAVIQPPVADEPPAGWDARPADAIMDESADRLAGLPFRMLGVDGDQFFYIPDRGHQIISLSASSHTKPNLMRLAALQYWEQEFPGRTSTDWDAAVNALIQRGQMLPKFDPRRIRGRGCWIDGDSVVYHAGDRLMVDGIIQTIPAYQSTQRAIYQGALEIPIEAGECATNQEATELIKLCNMLSWDKPMFGTLLAGWLALAPVCGALRWRPHIWITGGAGAGKSWTISNIVAPMVGETAVQVQGNTSEAGIRGQLGSDALPVVFDEAESEDREGQKRLDKVLELARQASSEGGAGIVKGTAQGGSITYLIRSMFAFSSIGVAATKRADTSRITLLNLVKNKGANAETHYQSIVEFASRTTHDKGFCARIRSRSLRHAKVIRHNCEVFSSVAVEFTGDKRTADQLGTLLAGAFSLITAKEIPAEKARDWMSNQDWTGFKSDEMDTDESLCLNHLLAAHINAEINGHRHIMSVSEIVEKIRSEPGISITEIDMKERDELHKSLVRYGMKIADDRLIVANRHQQLEKIYADTPWAGGKWAANFARITGSIKLDVCSFGHQIRQRATSIALV